MTALSLVHEKETRERRQLLMRSEDRTWEQDMGERDKRLTTE